MDRYHGFLIVTAPSREVQVFAAEMVAYRTNSVDDAKRWIDVQAGVTGWCGTASHPRNAHPRQLSCIHFQKEN